MIADAWEHAKTVFNDVVALDPNERSRLLEERCAGNPALRMEVDALLEASDDAGDFLMEPATAILRRMPVADDDAGDTVGPYRLVRRIGEGGFGRVFLAHQEAPLRRDVALKILKLGMDTDEVLARFDRERETLARMDHDHIARIYDAGVTEAGLPYVAIELVAGRPIVAYCDEHQLGIAERLELMRLVCYAVQHAHQKGVIHRDLKSSNVLVTDGDEEPVPKVIDFGIAKAVTADPTDRTRLTSEQITRPVTMLGTPDCMSPEQASRGDVDTRTDVYALGVMLYQLLTGALPFAEHRLSRVDAVELQRVICDVIPIRPSVRVAGLPADAADGLPAADTVARHLDLTVGLLGRSLQGDLDWIVMKALEKEPQRRYDSASELARDLERYLNNEPVLASPPSRAYRVRKFVGRHRVGVGVAAAIAGVLITATVVSASFAAATRRAQTGTRRALQLVTVVSSLDPDSMRGVGGAADGPKAYAVLADAAAEADGLEPADQVALRFAIGNAAFRLGHYELAADNLTRALDGRAAGGQPPDEQWAEIAFRLGLAQQELGLRDEARASYEEAGAIWSDEYGDLHATQATVLVRLASIAHARGNDEEALAQARAAVTLHETIDSEAGLEYAGALSMLGTLSPKAEAEALHRRAIEMVEPRLGRWNQWIATARVHLGRSLSEQGRYDEAMEELNRAYAIRTDLLSPDHAEIAQVLQSMGTAEFRNRTFARAVPYLRDALAIYRLNYGDDHQNVGVTALTLGMALSRIDESDVAGWVEAQPFFEDAMSILVASEPTSWRVSNAALEVATSHWRQGRFERAEAMLRETWSVIETDPIVAGRLRKKAILRTRDLYRAWGRADVAAEWQARLDASG